MGRLFRAATILAAAALACGSSGPASARTYTAAKYGGTVVVGVQVDPGQLDPTVSASGAPVVFATMCQRLYGYDARFKLVPLLAAAPPVLSDDKLSYTIRLRQGIRFNDGTGFNAQAVVANFQRYTTYPGSTR